MRNLVLTAVLGLVLPLAASAQTYHVSSRTIAGPGGASDVLYAAAVAPGGGSYYLAGYSSSAATGADIWVLKIDGALNVLSSITINGSANGFDSAYGIAVSTGGTVYVTGTTSTTTNGAVMWLGSFTSGLTPIASTTVTYGSFGDLNTSLDGIIVEPAGTLIAVGDIYVGAGSSGSRIWLGRFGSNLVIQSSATFTKGFGPEYGTAIARDTNGDIYIGGGVAPAALTSTDIWIGKYNSSLVFQASATVAGAGGNTDQCRGLVFGSNGHLFATGIINNSGTTVDAWYARYDTTLALVQSFSIAGVTGTNDQGNAIIRRPSSSELYATGSLSESGQAENILSAELPDYNLVAPLSTATVTSTGANTDVGYAIAYDTTTASHLVAGHVNGGADAWVGLFSGSPLPPNAPSAFTGVAQSSNSVRWSWTDNSSDETGFRVKNGGSNVSGDLAANTTTWLQTGLTPNATSGLLLVQAFNSTGTADSGTAQVYSLTDPPNSISATFWGSSATFSWPIMTNPPGTVWAVERGTDGVNYGTQLYLSSAAATYTDNTGLSLGTSYYYRIRSRNNDGVYSAHANASAIIFTGGTPLNPSGFTGSVLGTSSITWSWTDNSTNELGFRVMNGGSNLSGDLAADATSWTQTGLSSGTLYGPYFVRAFNSTGTADSGTASATTRVSSTGFYSGTGNPPGSAVYYGAAANPAGGWFVVGYSSSGASGADAVLLKVDSLTNPVAWTAYNGTGNGYDALHGVAVSSAGDVYVVGMTSATGIGSSWWIARYNSSLVLVASRTWSYGFSDTNTSLDGVAIQSDGNIVATGDIWTSASPTGSRIWTARWSPSLNLLTTIGWSNGFGPEYTDSLYMAPNGQYYISGAVAPAALTSTDLFVLKVSTLNVGMSTVTVAGGGGNTDQARGSVLGANGDLYVTGIMNDAGSFTDAWIARYNIANNFVLVSSRSIAGTAGNHDQGNTIGRGPNGTIVVAGALNQSVSNDDVWYAEFKESDLSIVSSTTLDFAAGGTDIAYDMVTDSAAGTAFLVGSTGTAGTSGWYAKVNLAAANLPAAPSGFAGTALSSSSLKWTWTDNAGNESGFRVMSGGVNLSGDLAANTTFWVQTGLSSSTLYGPYYVRAFNAAGTTESSTATATTGGATLPSAPSGFSGSAQSNASVLWSWTDNSSDELGFRVMLGTANLSGDLAAGTTFWLQTGLGVNTSSGSLFARAFNSSGTADSGSAAKYTLANAPASLASTGVFISSASVSWSANGNPGGTSFTLELSTSPGFSPKTTAATTATVFTSTGLTGNTSYYFRVQAQNQDGVLTVYTSSIAVFTSTSVALPLAPSAFAGAAQNTSSILWSWTDNSSNESGFRVLAGTFNVSGDLAANTTSWLQTGLGVNASSGSLLVQAFNSSGTASSGALTRYSLAAVPTGLTSSMVGLSSASFTWGVAGNPLAGATSFTLQLSTSAGFGGTVLSSTVYAGGGTLTGLTAATTYYARVNALNADAIATAYSATASIYTLGVTTLPAAPSGFAGAALSATSLFWSWTDNASNEAGFRVMSGTANVSGDLAANTTTWLQTALTPDTVYGPYFGRVFNSSGTADSSTATARTLANPPTGTAVSSYTASAATITWALNGNPATVVAQVFKSTDNASFSQYYSAAVTSMRDGELLGCTSYYYKVRNVNGASVATAYDATVLVRTPNTSPAPPASLSAEAVAGGRVFLSWTASPTEGITAYKLYSDGGTGSYNFGAPTAVFGSTDTSWTSGVLASSAAYSFLLRSVHRCGVEEGAGVTAVAASTATLAPVRVSIKNPDAGKRINGNSVTIMAELISGDPSQVASVRFQFRASTGAAWSDIVAANVNHPNPDTEAPYFVHWNVTLLAAGPYQLRAVATDRSGDVDPAPGAISVTVDAVTPDITESVVGGDIRKQQTMDNAVLNTIATGGDGANDALVKVVVPPGAVNTTTVTVTIESNPTITTASPSGFSAVGSALKIDLSNGQHLLTGGQTACLTMTYPANVTDPSALSIMSLNEATGVWSRDFGTTVNSSSRTITGCTPHFSIFAVFQGVATATLLDGVRLYPNPYKPNGGNPDEGVPFSMGNMNSGIIFNNLPATVTIDIYTLTGRRVARFDTTASGGTIRWDARNSDGRDCASGGYFAVVSSPGMKSVVKKFIILR